MEHFYCYISLMLSFPIPHSVLLLFQLLLLSFGQASQRPGTPQLRHGKQHMHYRRHLSHNYEVSNIKQIRLNELEQSQNGIPCGTPMCNFPSRDELTILSARRQRSNNATYTQKIVAVSSNVEISIATIAVLNKRCNHSCFPGKRR